MKKITILTVANAPYFQLLEGMVRSAEKNFPRANMMVELVNMGSEYLKIVEQWHSDIIVRSVAVEKSAERNFCTNRRAALFREYRKKESGPLIWIDADSLIRRPCNDLADHILSCDLTMRNKTKNKFAAGTIGIGNSRICTELVNRYYEMVKADTSWMSNQNNLNRLYAEFKKRINFVSLPNIYCDVWLSDEGIIWAAKARKKKSERYLRELNEFLK